MMSELLLVTILGAAFTTDAFAPAIQSRTMALRQQQPTVSLNMFDAAMLTEFVGQSAHSSDFAMLFGSDILTSFADQGQNLAGLFFQASLLPYLLFLYWLGFRGNRIPDLANFGFQFVLLFVLSTIPSGIISKATYGVSLANVDWLHGGAESLLTASNVLIVSASGEQTRNLQI
jgi:hypothetical protein